MTPRRAARFDFRLTTLQCACLTALTAGGLIAMAASVWAREPLAFGERTAVLERIDPNTASVASLRRLPGVGSLRAQAIVQYRQAHSPRPFQSADDLKCVPGIGEGTARAIAPFLNLRHKNDE